MRAYSVAVAALVAAVLLRWLADPLMGDSLPLVTLFGAVAAAVWVGGWRPALLVTFSGYVVCALLFIEPRGELGLDDPVNVVGLIAYVVTCALIVGIGEAARRAEARAGEREAGRLLAARLLASIVESSDDAIVRKTLDGTIQSWNAGAERLFGWSADEAMGRHISLIIPADRREEEDRIIASLRAGRRVDHFETVRVHKSGRPIEVSLTISPIRDEHGNVVGASKIARDVTERRRMEDHLRKLAADLSAANRQKNEFLATLAHELRNPLAPLSNMLEVLKLSGGEPGVLPRAVATMDRQLAHLVRLVDDLLDLSRVTHNRLELRKVRVELGMLVDQAVEAARPLADAAGHELRVVGAGEPIYLQADAVRLAQVFGNLLNNSCKYTSPGGTITVRTERRGGEAVVTVEDTGAGIPPEKLESIFDMFSQLDSSVERSHGGLGIGLTLVRRLVQMHGGSVAARSAGEGRGSTFVVRLPVAAAGEDAPSPAAEPAAAAPPVQPRRILVVDDNRDAAASLALLLEMAGHETYTAHDGAEAVEAVRAHRPEVVLLDIGLPILNGYEVCRKVRAQPWGEEPIVVALTGWGQEEDRDKSREAGFDGHLVKPVDFAELNALLRTERAHDVDVSGAGGRHQ